MSHTFSNTLPVVVQENLEILLRCIPPAACCFCEWHMVAATSTLHFEGLEYLVMAFASTLAVLWSWY